MRQLPHLTLWAALAGCESEVAITVDIDPYDNSRPGQLQDPTTVDRIVQVTTPEVDILFVIDDSCSMADKQDNLGRNFPRFLSYFLNSGLDYHIGVTSTDIDATGLRGALSEAAGARWVDADTRQPQDTFVAMATLGTGGSANEKGIGAAYLALEEERERANAGFYRDDASLHTVVLSDEEDQTQRTLIDQAEFRAWYGSLKDTYEARSFSSIVCTRTNLRGGCVVPLGNRYMTATNEIGGIVADILEEEYDSVLEDLGLRASGFRREYFLSQNPLISTIAVRVRVRETGATVVMVPGPPDLGDYLYDPKRNAIAFHEFVPAALDEVFIEYTPLSAAQDPSYIAPE